MAALGKGAFGLCQLVAHVLVSLLGRIGFRAHFAQLLFCRLGGLLGGTQPEAGFGQLLRRCPRVRLRLRARLAQLLFRSLGNLLRRT